MDERTPSAGDLREIELCLRFLANMTGPHAPPGHARALAANEEWPCLFDAELYQAVVDVRDILESPPVMAADGTTLNVRGWPHEARFALYQARSALHKVWNRWGMDDDPDREERLLPIGNMAIGDDLHAELRWSHIVLETVLRGEEPPAPVGPAPASSVFLKLAEDLESVKLNAPAALVRLLAEQESAPIDDTYFQAVHGSRVSPGAIRQNARRATVEANLREVWVRYRGLSREVCRTASAASQGVTARHKMSQDSAL